MTNKDYKKKGYYKLSKELMRDGLRVKDIKLLVVRKEERKGIKVTAKKTNLFIS